MLLKSTVALLASALVSVLASTSSFATEIDFSQIKKCSDKPVQVLDALQGFYGADAGNVIQGAQVDPSGMGKIWDDGLTIKDEQDGRVYPADTQYYKSHGFCVEQSMKLEDGLRTFAVALRQDREQPGCSSFVKHHFQFRYLPAADGQGSPSYQFRTGSQAKSSGFCVNLSRGGSMNPWNGISAPQRSR